MTVTPEELKIIEDHARSAARNETRKRLHWYRNGATVAFLVLALGIGYAVHVSGQKSYDARGVVCQIIKQGDVQAYSYLDDKVITAKQLKRALDASVTYRKQLAPGKGCDTHFTPRPKKSTEAPAAAPAPRKLPTNK